MTAARAPVRKRAWRRLGRRLVTPFPEVGGNAVTPLAFGGDDYFARMLAAIAGARAVVDVQMYLWHADELGRRFLEVMGDACERGVRVRVLVDAFGAGPILGGPVRAAVARGVDVRVFNPFRFSLWTRYHHRTHKKLLIVDREVAFVGGAGFSRHFSRDTRTERAWHDRMYELRGPIVHQLVDTFDVDFSRWGRRGEAVERTRPESAGVTPVGSATGRVLRGWPDAREFPVQLLAAVRGAQQTIRIGTPYFVPRLRLLAALAGALRRGVRVELVLPSLEWAHPVLWYAARRYVGVMLQRGAVVRYYAPSFYHAKIAVVDDTAALIGSSNLDGWSWRRNAELDLVFRDRDTVGALSACFEDDVRHAPELTPAEHRAAGLRHRTWQSVARIFARWM